jgi:hypothetical protein
MFGKVNKNIEYYYERDNIYLNVIFTHGYTSFPTNNTLRAIGETPKVASINVGKETPIIIKASDYYCSVIRFTIPLDTIPIMIMPVIPNQTNSNLTPFIIGIFYNGAYTPINLIYQNAHPNLPVPIQNIPYRQVITPYYFVYSYNLFINMLNYALQLALDTSGVQALFPGVKLAWFSLNDPTNLISLYVHHVFTDFSAPSPAINTPIIYINTPLKVFLDSWNYNFYGYDQLNGFEFSFILQNKYPVIATSTLTPTPDQAYGLYNNVPSIPPIYNVFTQEYKSIQLWSSLRKIFITSGTIPIGYEFEPPVASPTNPGITFNSSSNPSLPILTDFIPLINDIGESRSIAYYIPSPQYRLIDMISDTNIQNIDLNIYWQDKLGNTYPLDISLFEQASVKLGFFRKSLYKDKIH